MHNFEEVKKRFLKNNLAMRLGCIASDIARISSFSKISNSQNAVRDLIEESKFFIEWVAPDVSLNIQEELVNLQIQLALLNYSQKRQEIAKFADKWAKRILEISGLLKRD